MLRTALAQAKAGLEAKVEFIRVKDEEIVVLNDEVAAKQQEIEPLDAACGCSRYSGVPPLSLLSAPKRSDPTSLLSPKSIFSSRQ